MAAGTTGEASMSVQPPVAPHRVAIADIDISFWRMVMILVKWSFAAIPAMIIIGIIYTIIFGIIGFAMYSLGLREMMMQMFNKGVGI
jgi:hypothetical protein